MSDDRNDEQSMQGTGINSGQGVAPDDDPRGASEADINDEAGEMDSADGRGADAWPDELPDGPDQRGPIE